MGQMIDAVNPASIPAGYDGAEATYITVFSAPQGHVFDVEGGNASAATDVATMAGRLAAGRWSVAYVNETTEAEVSAELAKRGIPWAPAAAWPTPGVYLWAADPSGNIGRGIWKLPTSPLAVQNQYLGGYDLSTTADNFPVKVAGYLDGPQSAWPALAWERFRIIDDRGPTPPGPTPPTPHPGGFDVALIPSGKLAAPVLFAHERPNHPGQGWLFGADGGVFAYGNAPFYGAATALKLASPVTCAVVAEEGYTLVGGDGGTFRFGPGAPVIPSLA